MFGMTYPIDYRITHIYVGRCHVDLCPQHIAAIGKFAFAHTLEQVQVFLDAAIPVRARFSRFSQGAAITAHLFRVKTVDVGLALFDQINGVVE